MAPRIAALLAGIWAGGLLAIGGIAAPAAFAVAASDIAGRVAGRTFSLEASIGLGLAIALVLLLRPRPQSQPIAEAGRQSKFSINLMLVLAAIFCTVAGYFALQPMMVEARAGEGPLSFGALHALSAGFYAVKTLLVITLAWRLAAR